MHELLKSYISSFLNNIPESFGQRLVPVNYGHLFLLKKVKTLFSLAFPRQKNSLSTTIGNSSPLLFFTLDGNGYITHEVRCSPPDFMILNN
jgi:hypothetical protein